MTIPEVCINCHKILWGWPEILAQCPAARAGVGHRIELEAKRPAFEEVLDA